MREFYDEWLESGNQTYTAFGNVRAPSKIELCDMIVKAWDSISVETIKKSFVICGQVKHATPEDVTCLKDDHSASLAFPLVKELWNKPAHELIEIEDDENEQESEDEDEEVVPM